MNEDFAFFGKTLTGAESRSVRWKECVSAVDSNLGQLLGRHYIKDRFSDNAKGISVDMMNSLLAAMHEKLINIDWMDDETRDEGLLKLSKFREQIGFPDKWEDEIEVAPAIIAKDATYVNSVFAAQSLAYKKTLRRIGGPVDSDEWGMVSSK